VSRPTGRLRPPAGRRRWRWGVLHHVAPVGGVDYLLGVVDPRPPLVLVDVGRPDRLLLDVGVGEGGVVAGPPLRVAQRRPGLVDLLDPREVDVPGVEVWVQLPAEPQVGGPDLRRGGGLADPEHLVEVASHDRPSHGRRFVGGGSAGPAVKV
jgi:hypothetical protein